MKSFEIVVNKKLGADIQKKVKRILKPARSVGRPQKCLFCGVDTTWTINEKPVCPKCSIEYGFLDKGWLPGPCEVCGRQGEWWTDGDPQHFLCWHHRDDWFKWKIPELNLIDGKKEPEKWHQAWGGGLGQVCRRHEGKRETNSMTILRGNNNGRNQGKGEDDG